MPPRTPKGREPRVSATYRKIWATAKRVPKGRVATYGQIAALAGFPRQARLVGYALHSLPEKSDVPWHRVINARGEISFGKRTVGNRLQRAGLGPLDQIVVYTLIAVRGVNIAPTVDLDVGRGVPHARIADECAGLWAVDGEDQPDICLGV